MDNLITFPMTVEYNDLIQRFERTFDVSRIKNERELYGALKDFFPAHQPKQRQMNLFTEYYDVKYHPISPEEYLWFFKWRDAAYNRDTREFVAHKTGDFHKVTEKRYNWKWGSRILLIDEKGKIRKHFKDADSYKILSDEVE